MVCQTVKIGTECIFMKKNGCSYNGGRCYPIVESCKGCDRVATYEVVPIVRLIVSLLSNGQKVPAILPLMSKKKLKKITLN